MLETTFPEITVSAIDSDPIIPDPPNIRLLTGPLPNSGSDPNFFDLTPNDDIVQLANGILRNTPGGLRALAGDDFVRGSGGAELMNGNDGGDTLIGGCGNDTIRGGQDLDILYGECANDVLSGNLGDDYAYGGTGNDFVRGGKGSDALVGDSGNDTLIGDAGIDRLWGGEGADLFVLTRESGATSGEIGSDQPRPAGTFIANLEQMPAPPPPAGTFIANVVPTPPSPPATFDVVDEVPADFILDYNPAQDVIGLAGGLTRNDIVLSERFLTIGDARDYDSSGPFPPGQPRTADFRVLNTKATVIREASTGNILGLVKDVSPSQIQFISVSDGAIALG
ncbi:calcium-binding protein [Lyngbya sp. CCAP 1446/10]|uniref:calcium-binding protein n=1 Tax=Microcoleaceae TaxID=1892252 RepID=UPI0022380E94|nr:calcium-binding protein [Lyngbya sp. CCAP 1446/10]MCW6053185.1 calcium-binding protein [Lyngbya sp. CCAP 1446/10]